MARNSDHGPRHCGLQLTHNQFVLNDVRTNIRDKWRTKCLVYISVFHSNKIPCICCHGKFNKPVIWEETRRVSTHQTKQGTTNETQGKYLLLCYAPIYLTHWILNEHVTKVLLWIKASISWATQIQPWNNYGKCLERYRARIIRWFNHVFLQLIFFYTFPQTVSIIYYILSFYTLFVDRVVLWASRVLA